MRKAITSNEAEKGSTSWFNWIEFNNELGILIYSFEIII